MNFSSDKIDEQFIYKRHTKGIYIEQVQVLHGILLDLVIIYSHCLQKPKKLVNHNLIVIMIVLIDVLLIL